MSLEHTYLSKKTGQPGEHESYLLSNGVVFLSVTEDDGDMENLDSVW